MEKKKLNILMPCLLVGISAFAGQYLHIDKRIIMLLGITALLAWVIFLSIILLGRLGNQKTRRRP